MTLGSRIALFRRKQNITQEVLAQQLGVTNQAVSKWESDQCCPDVMLLPKLADIFETSIDALFDREKPTAAKLPWEDDGVLRAVLFIGQRLVKEHPACGEIEFQYDGAALQIQSDFSVSCEDVKGDVYAKGDVDCGDISGNVHADGDVDCSDVAGNVAAGGDVSCGDLEGSVQAGGDADCGDVEGNVTAGGDVSCGDVEGTVQAGRDVECGDVKGNITAGGRVSY